MLAPPLPGREDERWNRYEEEQGVLLRKDPKSGEIVGVTILDYEEHFRQLPDLSWLATKPLPEELIAYLRQRPTLHI